MQYKKVQKSSWNEPYSSSSVLFFLLLYAAFNAPCVGHKDDESQAILVFDNPTLLQTASLTANLNQWVESARVIFVFFVFFLCGGGQMSSHGQHHQQQQSSSSSSSLASGSVYFDERVVVSDFCRMDG